MVYAYNGIQERKELWERLCTFKRSIQGAWVICGDFNIVLVPAERLGGNITVEEMEDFKACLVECEVADVPASGSFYTWCNKQVPSTRIYSRLDRVLVNHKWLHDNSSVYAQFYCEGVFDHTPCVIQAFDDREKKIRSFKYYNMWSQDGEFKQCVQTNWKGNWYGTKMYKVTRQLKNLKIHLRKLNKENFADIENNCNRAKMNLEYIQDRLRVEPQNTQLIEMETEASNSVRFLDNACHEFLVQKSKVTWMEKGDSNTKFFHNVIKGRQSRGKVWNITNTQGVLCEDIDSIQTAFLQFYTSLLGTSTETRQVCKAVVQRGQTCTEDHQQILLSPVSDEEIKKVMFSIPSHKVAGRATYSLVLNGETCGYFKGAKGLRQGDPLSPLLFTVAMEYFSRILAYTTDTMAFKFHPMCGKLRLSHLMFADDLLLFSKGDVASIMVLLRSFSTFLHASGLQMNATKTNAYFKGVSKELKADVLQVSGFIEGQLPFRYLGIPITCGKLTKQDCQVLVERIVSRIRGFGTKNLSYSGRLVLVNSVLTTLYNYWINIFLIPKDVLNKINSICRHYLWDGSVDFIRVPPVGWEKFCSPKAQGGLGIRDSLSWNIAAIGKLVWWIYFCADRLWVKWVHQVYLKGNSWNDYNPTGDVSWGWKVICRTKNKLAHGYNNDKWMLDHKGYSIGSGYELIRPKFQEGSSLQKNVLMCVVLAAFYHIWMQINKVQVDACLLRPECVIVQIKKEVKIKLSTKTNQGLYKNDLDWWNAKSVKQYVTWSFTNNISDDEYFTKWSEKHVKSVNENHDATHEWQKAVTRRITKLLIGLKYSKKKADWVPDTWWENLKIKEEKNPEYAKISKINTANRKSGAKDGKALGTHTGESATPYKLFEKTKKNKKGEWVNPRAAKTDAAYKEEMSRPTQRCSKRVPFVLQGYRWL
ncbi:uncharacterized protein LOC141589875 [Silene latifolia]|uniref:uncharacterized protein LOC141589875 n=1 Tax=Silene latifolia TaxID=37657 RepID=UPI003D770104